MTEPECLRSIVTNNPIMSSGSFNEGQRDGSEWLKKAKQGWITQRLDPFHNPKPHRSGDPDYNKGVEKAIKDGGGNTFF